MKNDTVIIRRMDRQDYQTCWQSMREFTDRRDETVPDEIWVVEHDPVFTQGQNGKAEHILNPGTIPVIKVDRGGQVTYHGPGQLVVYTLIDLKRKKFNVRELVTLLEQSIIDLLQEFKINAAAKREAPGIYVAGQKICSIGLRIRRGCSYHGLALNVAMDLEPFSRINPCGFQNLKMTQLADFGFTGDLKEISLKLINYLTVNLGYTVPILVTD
ncbi:MAG: lipoyl(octanoyl) transferase LipB [Gammaproteobacteria bacterium]